MAQSPEQRELSLVGKVEMRIALTDTDAKLSTTLNTYLPPLLLKLGSQHAVVRNKVVSICQHINTRVKPNSIQLPVAALIKQFKSETTSLVRHFDILYIQQGIDRLSNAEKADLLPLIIGGFATAGNHAPQIFNLFLKVLEYFVLPLRGSKEDIELRTKHELSDEDVKAIAEWLGKLILFTPSRSTALSKADIEFLTLQGKPDVWSSNGFNILRVKALGTRLLSSGIFTDEERFIPSLYASADTASTVSDIGDDLMKRVLPSIDFESGQVLDKLFDIYFKASPPLRMKILGLLNKSVKSTTYGDEIMKIIEDGITPPDGEDVTMSNTKPGRQELKLRTAVFEYINFVARYGSKEILLETAPKLVSRLQDFIETQGWPKPGSSEDLSTRAYAYEVIGLLIKAGPRSLIFENEATLLRWLFTSLASDASGNVSIDEAVSTVLGAMSRLELTLEEQSSLEDLLLEQMMLSDDMKNNQRLRSTRSAAVRFANRCLPFSSVKARWIDLLALKSDEKNEVREESERGLSPYWYLLLRGQPTFPQFDQMIAQASILDTKSLEFARHLLLHEALADRSPALTADWERNLDTLIENDLAARNTVKKHLEPTSALETFQRGLFSLAVDSKSSSLTQYLSLIPESLLIKLTPHVADLIPAILSNNHTARAEAAHCFGILASHPSVDHERLTEPLLRTMKSWKTAVGAQINQVHGSIIALAYFISRKRQRAGPDAISSFTAQYTAILTQEMLNITDSTLKDAQYIALGQICIYDVLMFDDLSSFNTSFDKVFEAAKTGNEKAILCLGQMSVGRRTSEQLSHAETKLRELHEVKQAEVHFSVGEALSYLASGWQSEALATKFDLEGSIPEGRSNIDGIAERIFADCTNTKPSLKKAAVMWLLCLVQYCGDQMQSKLAQCQAVFKKCLVDRDDLVQETASRGLGLVYEKGDRSLKDDLVRDLVSSFSSDKQSLSGTVSADTQLFDAGALPTGDGSVSTYKDIMSLASEVGDSSLVYRFMSMASSNAIWSSRAAFGRFGLSNVLSDSSIDGYLANNPKLYPKLYRYRFDPNSGVRRSMNDIWNALVKDSATTIDTHFDAIIQDLLLSILGKEWRVRQAACAAIADLLQGRSIDRYETYLEDVWNKCFKVLDDIKESVRAAAASLARSLTGILTRSLESDSSAKTSSAMLKHVLPFLLSPSGMESSAQEVQLFAVHTLLEIIKKSNGQILRPFIPELVERLIGLLSTLEPEAVNYIHLNASKYNLTEQKIDDMRLSSVRSSPIMEAVERCLDLLDDETMQRLQPKLEHAMRSAVGLPSKVGASRILVTLSTRRAQVFKPVADHFLKVLEKLVLDRNETVASSYAAAVGYIARHASEKQFLRLAAYANILYFKTEGDREGATPRRSITSGEIVYAVVKQASDRFNAVAAEFLPLVYIAKHDSDSAVKEQFQNTWSEAVGGARAVQLYLREILALIKENLDSPQWTLKHTSARSIADATITIGASMTQDTATALWPVLEKALSGKTWEGKEVVLEAFVKYAQHAPNADSSGITKIAIREAKRNNPSYRQHAFKALAEIAAAQNDIDISVAVQEVVVPVIDELQSEDAMDVDKPSGILDNTLAAAVECLILSATPKGNTNTNKTLHTALSEATKVARPSMAVRRATYQSIKRTFEKLEKNGDGATIDATNLACLQQLLFGPDSEIEALRTSRADAVLQISHTSPLLMTALRGVVEAALTAEKSASVRDRLDEALATVHRP